MTQNEYLLKHFRSGKSITSLKASRHGIMDLPKRVCELLKKGHDVQKKWVTVRTRYGNGKVRVVEYRIG